MRDNTGVVNRKSDRRAACNSRRPGRSHGRTIDMSNIPQDTPFANSPSKVCPGCKASKPLDQFSKDKTRVDGYQRLCKECNGKDGRRYRAANYTRVQTNRMLEVRYGITDSVYEQMLIAQGYVCAICHEPETARANNGRVRRLAVDHCHETGQVRGLLCHKCNRLLGDFSDNPDRLHQAAEYLRGKR